MWWKRPLDVIPPEGQVLLSMLHFPEPRIGIGLARDEGRETWRRGGHQIVVLTLRGGADHIQGSRRSEQVGTAALWNRGEVEGGRALVACI
jgi:hypothetical protein